MTKLTAISLFSGAGGDTLGMKNAGIDVLGYVEFDKNAILTHNHNFPNCNLIGENIIDISYEEFEKYKDVDIVFGGFPCQSFSHGGNKKANDPRGFLYMEFVRAVGIIKPKLIIGENVKGLLSRKMENGTLFIEEIVKEFSNLGYNVKYELFNLSNFGIPQTRERILIYGIRKDLDIRLNLSNVIVPDRKYNKDIIEFSLERALKIEKKNIIDLIPSEQYTTDMKNDELPSLDSPTNLIKCYNNDSLSFKKRSKPTYGCIIDKLDYSRTILCSYGRMPRLFVPIKNKIGSFLRPYTIKELQCIQGFPTDFEFKGNYLHQVTQIGNAIPPVFITHIMTYVKDILTGEVVELMPLEIN